MLWESGRLLSQQITDALGRQTAKSVKVKHFQTT